MAESSVSPGSFNFQSSLSQTYDAFANKVVGILPELIGAIALVIIGWFVALGVRIAVRKLIKGIDAILPPSLRLEWLQSGGLRFSYASLLSRVAFWTVMLFFVAAAANLIGWSLFTDWTQSLVRFLPQLITGMIIIFAGLLLGSGVKTLVTRAAASAKLQKPELIGRLGQVVVVFTMSVIGVEQLGINVHFLTESLVVVVGVFLAGGALAFGLGARALASNVIGAQNCRKIYHIGQEVSIDGVTGSVAQITSTAIVLETSTGQAIIPASHFDEHISLITRKTDAIEASATHSTSNPSA